MLQAAEHHSMDVNIALKQQVGTKKKAAPPPPNPFTGVVEKRRAPAPPNPFGTDDDDVDGDDDFDDEDGDTDDRHLDNQRVFVGDQMIIMKMKLMTCMRIMMMMLYKSMNDIASVGASTHSLADGNDVISEIHTYT